MRAVDIIIRKRDKHELTLEEIEFFVRGFTNGDIPDYQTSAFAMAILPEELPVILTIFLALGAWRMAKHQALVRRTPAIEALGSIGVLCTDKTGTLTENRMQVTAIWTAPQTLAPAPTTSGAPSPTAPSTSSPTRQVLSGFAW